MRLVPLSSNRLRRLDGSWFDHHWLSRSNRRSGSNRLDDSRLHNRLRNNGLHDLLGNHSLGGHRLSSWRGGGDKGLGGHGLGDRWLGGRLGVTGLLGGHGWGTLVPLRSGSWLPEGWKG